MQDTKENSTEFKNISKEEKSQADNSVGHKTNQNPFFNLHVKQSKKRLTPEQVIRSLLRAKNWKQTELADKIGLSRQGLNNYLRGFWDFPTSIKIKIAQAFEVDSAAIWDLEKNG